MLISFVPSLSSKRVSSNSKLCRSNFVRDFIFLKKVLIEKMNDFNAVISEQWMIDTFGASAVKSRVFLGMRRCAMEGVSPSFS